MRERVNSSPNFPRRHKILFGVIIAVGIIVYAAFNVWVYRYTKEEKALLLGNILRERTKSGTEDTPTPAPFPTPTPIQLHEGIGEYAVSHNETNGPSIVGVIFDPLDVRKDQILTLSVNLRSQNIVTSVTGTLETDTASIPLNFTLSLESKGVQTWITKITMTDTIWYTYIAIITAKSNKGETSVTVAPRS